MRRWVAIALLTLVAACASAPENEADVAAAWETQSPNLSGLTCTYLGRDRYVVVPDEHRDAALRVLRERPIVVLDDADIGFEPEAPPGFRAYLVRAVSKFRSPIFVVRDCGDLLFVMNGALGRSTPPSSPMPLVVMLDEEPSQLVVTWEIAE